ncbi:Uncharacterised protein [Mycobacteroides abscessus subsp. abscessus]|jgi:hypothetical protein|uniref:Uncharacterized protein n=2 Tax=Mycobacteriaceae TaxID=1762 RepID=A0AB37BS41_9MYCO|nr:hypothetical protein A3N96_01380 [Mycobacteroides abscessus]QST89458.1 antitoxin [Mycobacterium phage prophiGD43A-5]SHV70196.1 Uncharacterised protein [Mycobacteroides abscessus subsp. abscessus]SKF80088.1 Uncharacterised protein [Mycobacteroides abscessus subsp. bolletii]SKI84405.1 Uncharacterised protein [Mycobacteroides abscessus subsp. massiliense]
MTLMSSHSEADLKRLTFGDDLVVDDIDLDKEEFLVGDGVRLTNDAADKMVDETLAEVRRQNIRP